MSRPSPEISIIIRSKDEERWIGHCLKMVYEQSCSRFEVILVDNESRDHTIEVARRYPVDKVLSIKNFRPGLAINEGVRASAGKYLVCLSAHCIPESGRWLASLVKNFEDPGVAGVYGRQLPMSFSEDSDKRDLLITFGLDRRVQVKDYFFHNANSMVRRDVWEKIPFDEKTTNIEDRIWGKAVVAAGYKLVYEPEAAVYHYHGIHQANNSKRARSVVSVIEHFEKDAINGLPESFRAANCNVAAVVPVLGGIKRVANHDLLQTLLRHLKKARYVKSVYTISESPEVEETARREGVHHLQRPADLLSSEKTIEDVLKYALGEIEKRGDFPDAILNANYLYPFRPEGFFDELVEDLQHKGLDTVFTGFTDYQNFWVRDANGGFNELGEGLKSREHKQPIYESLYGVGCLTASHVIRSGRLVGGRVGILPLADRLYTIKHVDERSENLIKALLPHFSK